MYTPGDALADGEHHGGGEEEGDGDADRQVDERLHLARVNTVLHRHDRLRSHDRRPAETVGIFIYSRILLGVTEG